MQVSQIENAHHRALHNTHARGYMNYMLILLLGRSQVVHIIQGMVTKCVSHTPILLKNAQGRHLYLVK